MEQILNYINGDFCPPKSRQFIDNFEPASGAVYSEVADSDQDDLANAYKSAQLASRSWAMTSLDERASVMLRIADGIEAKKNDLARAESIDNGKPINLALTIDIPRAASNIRFFAHALTQFSSESHSMGELAINYTLREPHGIVACISPWNLPLYLLTWKIAPAIAMGNVVIAKPSELTPKTASMFAQICGEAGLPAGVLNILHGRGAKIGAALCAHPGVKVISFTGGSETGRQIAQSVAGDFKKISLELGGKNPSCVFSDCDFESTVQENVFAAFKNQGQICLAASRILIEESIYERFVESFLEKIRRLKIGDPLDPAVDFSALVSSSHLDKVLSYIDLARQEGGKILCGGERVKLGSRCKDGYFLAPTVISGLKADSRINQEEIFGPVVTLQSFSSDQEALALANDSIYGLSATVWTKDLFRAHRFAQKLESGIVWINTWLLRDLRTPFGGYKSSGLGREGGLEALRFFTQAKNVCIKYEQKDKEPLRVD